MAKRSVPPEFSWHFFLPTVGGFVITWIFAQDLMTSLQVATVVFICSLLSFWLQKK